MGRTRGEWVSISCTRSRASRWSLEPRWQALFEIQCASEFSRMAERWWALLPCLHAALTLMGVLVLWHPTMDKDQWMYLLIAVFGWVVIGVSLKMIRTPAHLMSRDRWLPWATFAMLSTMAYGMSQYSNRGLIQYALMLCTLVVIIYMWALRPSLRAAAKFVALNVIATPVLLASSQSAIAASYTIHMFLVCAVGLFCVSVREDQDRYHFLHLVRLHEAETLLKSTNQGLDDLARRDALTSLPNRRALNESLQREYQRAKRNGSTLAVLMVDIDHFKQFNDFHGHLEGDACLVSVAQALRSGLQRPGDTIARLGGEEFAVLLPDTDLKGAQEVAERLLRYVDDLGLAHETSGTASHVTVSIGGVVLQGQRAIGLTQALQVADDMLYRVKARGRHASLVQEFGKSIANGARKPPMGAGQILGKHT